MNITSCFHSVFCSAIALVLLAGCAPPKPPEVPSEVKKVQELEAKRKKRELTRCKKLGLALTLNGQAELNQSPKGQSMPVQVRVYSLKDRQTFDGLDYDALWKRDAEELAEDLARKPLNVTVYPGEPEISVLKATPEVAYLAVAGLFRQPQGEQWRVVVDLAAAHRRCKPGAMHTPLVFQLKNSTIVRVKLSSPKKGK